MELVSTTVPAQVVPIKPLENSHPIDQKTVELMEENVDVDVVQKGEYDNTYDSDNMNEIFNKKEQFQGIMKKYWNQRHDIFQKYEEGILLTKELWFSVTPEIISKFTAKLINEAFKGKNNSIYVMDAFSGGGGNVNQFLKFKNNVVFAADINHIHLYCTNNNALVYFPLDDVNSRLKILPLNWEYAYDKIDPNFVNEKFEEINVKEKSNLVKRVYANKEESIESLEILKSVGLDCIFGSPPWGGPEYIKEKNFNLNHILPYRLEKLLKILLDYSDNICLFLPKNSNLMQMQKITENIFHDDKMLRVFRMTLHGRPKGLLCCWGPAFLHIDLSDIEMDK